MVGQASNFTPFTLTGPQLAISTAFKTFGSPGTIAALEWKLSVAELAAVVERAPVRELFRFPQHPYTVGLLRCLPRGGVRKDQQRLDTIPGIGRYVAEALSAHPRIGQRAAGASTEADWSRQEQASVQDSVGEADAEVQAALEEGNRVYEQRFGHVFLIRASGRSAEELLAALRQRLANDPDTEWDVVAEELREITRLRLERLLQP
jgi:OHCU decarboxylase